MQKFEENGCVRERGRGHLCVKRETEWLPFDVELLRSDNVCVAYVDIIKLDNAYEYCRENGISYFFHLSEASHRPFPHIHARYSGEEISIFLNNLKVEGKFGSKTKQREAVEYVKSHKDDLLQEWFRIMQ